MPPRQPIAASAMLALWLLGCHHTVAVSPNTVRADTTERIVGVVFKNGERFEFPSKEGWLQGDTVYAALVNGRPIPLDSVSHLLVRKVSPAGVFVAVLGVAAAAAALTVGIVAATKESCPFVYSWDGNQWVFDAEPYGGAVTRGLTRDDYGVLEHLRAVDGEYRIHLSNEVNESQMTDLLELWVVDHPAQVYPVLDEFGRLYTVTNPRPPVEARDQAGRDLLPWLRNSDDLLWEPLPSGDLERTRDTVTLTFSKPEGATQMKLVARVATGIWGSHQVRSLLSLYGGTVDAWYRRVDDNPLVADSLRQWGIREGLYGLAVEVWEPEGWQIRGVLPSGGPLIAEDRVIPLDVSRIPGRRVQVRFRPARSFWAFNSFGADFSPGWPAQVDTVPVRAAVDRAGRDVRSLLTVADGRDFPLPSTGDLATVTFRAPPERPGLTRSVFLHARGWYHLLGLPDHAQDSARVARVFGEPEFAARLAAEEYRLRLQARRP